MTLLKRTVKKYCRCFFTHWNESLFSLFCLFFLINSCSPKITQWPDITKPIHKCIYTFGTSQFIFEVLTALSLGADQNASGHNWMDLQPIRATKCVTHQWQPSWLFKKMPQRCLSRALLCSQCSHPAPHQINGCD